MKAVLAGKAFDYVIDVSWQDVAWVANLCEALSFETVKKLKNRENITFKENVDKNLYEIIAELPV